MSPSLLDHYTLGRHKGIGQRQNALGKYEYLVSHQDLLHFNLCTHILLTIALANIIFFHNAFVLP
jgi:hypothetical protein